MATISNVKNVDMQQLEFQNLGSSAVQTVLQQPLLKNASTYTSELVSMELSLDNLPLIPEGGEFLTVGLRGLGGMVGDMDEFNNQLSGSSTMEPWYGDLIPSQFGHTEWMDPADAGNVPEWFQLPAHIQNIATAAGDYDATSGFWKGHAVFFDITRLSPDPFFGYVAPVFGAALDTLWLGMNYRDYLDLDEDYIFSFRSGNAEGLTVRARHYTSRLGMVQDLHEQVSRLGALLRIRSDMIRRNLPKRDWQLVPYNERYLSLQIGPEGRLILRVEPECLRDYWFRLGDGFRRLFGDNRYQFIMGLGDHVVVNQQDIHFPTQHLMNDGDLTSLDFELWWPDAGGVPIVPGLPNDWSYDLQSVGHPQQLSFLHPRIPSNIFYHGAYPNWRPDRFRYFPSYNVGGRAAIRSEDSFALVEVPRRKLIVEASYPISHTTSWETDQEKRHMQFQEFKVVPELDSLVCVNTGNHAFREKVYSAARIFLDNHGTLALKKLFEGQLQALRIDVLEELEDDNDVRTRVPVKLRKNGFMYLKWLFTKETV